MSKFEIGDEVICKVKPSLAEQESPLNPGWDNGMDILVGKPLTVTAIGAYPGTVYASGWLWAEHWIDMNDGRISKDGITWFPSVSIPPPLDTEVLVAFGGEEDGLVSTLKFGPHIRGDGNVWYSDEMGVISVAPPAYWAFMPAHPGKAV